MALTYSQKHYIKKNLKIKPIEEIAKNLGISEKDIHQYLKKRWRPEKYKKFLRSQTAIDIEHEPDAVSFSFIEFLHNNRLAIAFFIFLVFAVYANSFGNAFVSDDIAGFAKNENIGRFSNIFASNLRFSVQSLFSFVAYHIGGLHPFSFRIINILSHLGCVIVIYILLSLSIKKRVAVMAASLFAVHPILTESVSWISGGIYSYYSFFFLLSFLFYLFSKNNQKYLYYSIFFFVLTFFASEKAMILSLVFVLYEFTFGSFRKNWKRLLPYILASALMLILLVSNIGSRVSSVETQTYQSSEGMFNPLFQIPVALGSYLKLIFWPASLTLYQTEMNFTQAQFFFLVFILLIYLGTVAWSWFKNKTIFFWLVFFVITLLPTLTPFKISWIVAERYVYLGTLGIVVAVAILTDKFLELNENARMVGYFLLILTVISLSVRTIIRNRDWRNEDTLWLATAKVSPSGQVIHNNLGDVYARQGNFEKSIEEFKKAIEINPNYADAYHNLANDYQKIGQTDLAVENYQKALSINPKIWQSYQNLAAIYFNSGQHDLALENIKKALELNPGDENLKNAAKYIEENKK